MTYLTRSATNEAAYLDRPVWHALKTRQRHLSVSRGDAVMFRPEFSNFGATGPDGEGEVQGFSDLVAQSDGGLALMQTEEFTPPDTLRCTLRAEGLQMVLETVPSRTGTPEMCLLGGSDAQDMLRLVALTEPGPFRLRTGTLGTYLGVRREGQLIAMAGERLKLPGFTEISAVCVHPDHRGTGLARALIGALINEILSRNETPMLHLYSDNLAARALYESLGFRLRARVLVMMIERACLSADQNGKHAPSPSSEMTGDPND